jgi:hypothetical protein
VVFRIPQGNLNRLVDWCGANSLEVNVGKCRSIIFSRLRHPVKFCSMLGAIILDYVDSITDLGVVMDSRMSFSMHIDVAVGKALGRVCEKIVRRLSGTVILFGPFMCRLCVATFL